MMSTVEAAASSVSARRAGIVLIAATVLSVVAMAHHPSIASHDAAEAVAEHARVLDAILARDGDGAEGAMRGHIERSWRRLRGLMAD